MPQLNKGGKYIFGFSVLQSGMELLSIRSSDIAFSMGAKGPLLKKAYCFQGRIERY